MAPSPIKDSKEHPLQAVILVDNFDPKLAVFEKPWGLVPLVGIPLIDYTVEFISRTEIRHVTVVTCQNTVAVEEYMKKWENRFETLNVLVAETCLSLGDVLRELDRRALIKGDFFLLRAGTLCSSSLRNVIEEYRQRRQKDKSCVLTLIAREQSKDHPSRLASPNNGDVAMLLDEKTGKLRFYQQMSTGEDWRKLNVSVTSFSEESDLRFDLSDCQMALCSPQIPPLFSDNFDFQNRQDLIKEILTNEEILGQQIHVHILPTSEYAATVSDYGSYVEIGKQVLQRWSYPLTPDTLTGSSGDNTTRYLCYPRFQYLPEKGTSVAREGLGRGVLVGPGTQIGPNSKITNTIIGKNCVIGINVILENCVLWDEVHIGSGTKAQCSIFCSGVTVDSDCRIEPRSILRAGVTLAEGITVASGSVISGEKPNLEDDEIQYAPAAKLNFGKTSGELTYWRLRYDSGPKTAEFWPENLQIPRFDGNEAYDSELESDDSEPEKPLSPGRLKKPGSKRGNSPPPSPSAGVRLDSICGVALTDEAKQFYKEVFESLDRGVAMKLDCNDLKTEVNCSKFAYNVSMDELQMLLVRSILEIVFRSISDSSLDIFAKITMVFGHMTPLLKNYFTAESAQRNALSVFEEFALSEPHFCTSLTKTLYFLYEKEILTEEAILEWYEELQGPEEMKLKENVEPLVTWLKEAEEDSESD